MAAESMITTTESVALNGHNREEQTDCCLTSLNLRNYVQPGYDNVCVNIGCRNGNEVVWLAGEVGSNGYVYGIDPSDQKIREAFNTAEQMGVTNVDFIKSPLEKIRLNDEVAHLVMSGCTINRSDSREQVWNEIYRILKKGGHFVVSDVYVTGSPQEPDGLECAAGAITRGKYLEMLYNSGFTTIRIVDESKAYTKGNAEMVTFTVTGEKPAKNHGNPCRI